MTVNLLMIKTILGKFRAQQKSVKLQVVNCVITKKRAHALLFFNNFAYYSGTSVSRNIFHLLLSQNPFVISPGFRIKNKFLDFKELALSDTDIF